MKLPKQDHSSHCRFRQDKPSDSRHRPLHHSLNDFAAERCIPENGEVPQLSIVRPAVAVMSPGDACWICERPLPDLPQAVLVGWAERDEFFLICSASCADAVAEYVSREFPDLGVRLLDGQTAFDRWVEATSRTMLLASNATYKWARLGNPLRIELIRGPQCGADENSH